MKHVIALVLALALNAAANLMMKIGSGRFDTSDLNTDSGLRSLAAALAANWVLVLGLLCFAINVMFYAYALRATFLPVSMAYPIMVGGGFAIIALVAWWFLGERMSAVQWAGVVMILLGVFLVAREVRVSRGA
ncbi:MAG: DMT family transporter [Phycisphaerae bacterium]